MTPESKGEEFTVGLILNPLQVTVDNVAIYFFQWDEDLNLYSAVTFMLVKAEERNEG